MREVRVEYRRLGDTGPMVSELCLGCMTFGREADEEASKGLVARFLEVGGNRPLPGPYLIPIVLRECASAAG
jgi:hypothetical protein